jgi:hypothetical protein
MPPLVLSEDEIQQLQGIASSRSLPHSIGQRVQIVLACPVSIGLKGGVNQVDRCAASVLPWLQT